MAKKKNNDLEPKLESRIKALKKFCNSNPESLYINNGFYTNKYLYIDDPELSNIPSDFKILKDGYKKILNKNELQLKFVNDFKNKKWLTKKMEKSEFKNFYNEMKKFSFEQIKIRNGKFALFDTLGHPKWKIIGESEVLKNIYLDFDYKLFLNILYFINELQPLEVVFYSNETYLIVKLISGGNIKIYARGVILEGSVEQKK